MTDPTDLEDPYFRAALIVTSSELSLAELTQEQDRSPGDRDVAWTPVELDSADGRVCLYLWRPC